MKSVQDTVHFAAIRTCLWTSRRNLLKILIFVLRVVVARYASRRVVQRFPREMRLVGTSIGECNRFVPTTFFRVRIPRFLWDRSHGWASSVTFTTRTHRKLDSHIVGEGSLFHGDIWRCLLFICERLASCSGSRSELQEFEASRTGFEPTSNPHWCYDYELLHQ